MQNILFYDGKCTLCSREMSWLEKHKDSTLLLIDAHTADLTLYDVDLASLLAILH